MIDQIDDAVQERDIVGYYDKRVFVFLKIALEPFDMFGIEIIGWLVQQKDIRLFQQQLSEQHLCALTAGKPGDIAIRADFRETQRAGNLVDFAVDIVEVVCIQKFLELSEFLHHGREGFVVRLTHLRA